MAGTPGARRALCRCLEQSGPSFGVLPDRARQLPALCKLGISIPVSPHTDCDKRRGKGRDGPPTETSWIMLERFVFHRDDADDGSFPGKAVAPLRANSVTSLGDPFTVALLPAAPPAFSRLYVHWLRGPRNHDERGRGTELLSAHGDLLLLSLTSEVSLADTDTYRDPYRRSAQATPGGVHRTHGSRADGELHWKAFDGLAAPFAEFMAAACADEATRPHWVIADCFHHWVAAAAVQHKETAPMYDDQGASGMSTVQRWHLTKNRCALAVIRSCVEWEPESFPLVPKLLEMPVVPLGLLPPSSDGGRRADGTNGSAEHATVRWLDAQPPGSVVYVALGSEVPLPLEQVHELALGLELAGTRFLWALRKPSGAAVLDDGADMLPPGFQERARGVGLVTTGWIPQMSILAHAAVGGFLTHCGRNSLIEGLLFGHPLVMLPIFGDQGPNARQMEAKKAGLQVARDESDGSFDRHGIASAVRDVMVDGEARMRFVAGPRANSDADHFGPSTEEEMEADLKRIDAMEEDQEVYMKRENAGSWSSGLEKEQMLETYSAQLQKS
ncbi:UDP-glycosyltransferase 91C1 [Triticum urartu]|uniref:Glycosyltransferase n=1 Tax=Triticum urartu TaxID=4572 RepID=M8AR79_TRIUA|nr:UDP-glycosyltransferase 91C1 [Triticum urartu]